MAAEPAVCAFADVAAPVGLSFQHDRGASPRRHLPETMGAGVAWFDFDGDGWADLYAVDSGPFPPGEQPVADRLFRNLGNGTFEDVSQRAGVAHRGYGQGVVVADVDADGWRDLLITAFGRAATQLRNRGDGTFEDVTAVRGPQLDGWASSAAFADGDGDGDLDLYVARYLLYDARQDLFCGDPETGERTYCDPSLFFGAPDRYFVNTAGTFADASAAAGLGADVGRGLGVLFTDLDGDFAPDLYVANDLTLNLLFHNRRGGTFADVSLLSGAAVGREGKPLAGMGLVAADFDEDGDPELAVTNFDVELNSLYRNLGELLFEDVSAPSGFGVPSFNLLGFGIVAADFDGDGHLDSFIANGHIFERPRRANTSYRQRPLLLLGDGRGRFREQKCATFEAQPQVARGLATADFDRDGDPDLAIGNNGGPLQLRRLDRPPGPWLGVRLQGRPPNTAAVGARVTLHGPQGRQTRWVQAGESYLSANDSTVLFNWPTAEPPTALEIRWPSGTLQRLEGVSGGGVLEVSER